MSKILNFLRHYKKDIKLFIFFSLIVNFIFFTQNKIEINYINFFIFNFIYFILTILLRIKYIYQDNVKL